MKNLATFLILALFLASGCTKVVSLCILDWTGAVPDPKIVDIEGYGIREILTVDSTATLLKYSSEIVMRLPGVSIPCDKVDFAVDSTSFLSEGKTFRINSEQIRSFAFAAQATKTNMYIVVVKKNDIVLRSQ